MIANSRTTGLNEFGDNQRPPVGFAGERRPVTALFYDIVNSTGLLNALDPEDFGVMQRRIHEEAAAAIRSEGGHFERMMGDGGCAYFGYPLPAEDAAECAVAAGLDLVERCRALSENTSTRSPLSVRVGIATGVVVISSTRGAGLPGEAEIIGLAPALASRIQSEAEPNSVAVADTTYRVTRLGFEYEHLGSLTLKGFREPQALWRPRARRRSEARFTTSRRFETPLIGRGDELELCRRRWALASGGRGQAIFLSGEPGIGKSRLVAELRRDVTGAKASVRLMQCQPRGNARPLHAFLDCLSREIFGSVDRPGRPDLDAIWDYLSLNAPGATSATAETIDFLFEDEIQDDARDRGLAALSPEEIKRRYVNAALQIAVGWSRVRPQLFVIEDLHWADTLTDELVARLIDEVESLPILVVVTTRNPASAALAGGPHELSIALSRLDATGIQRMLDSIWDPLPRPAGLDGFVYDRSDGVPLFAEELAHFLKERFGGAVSIIEDWSRALRESGITTLQDLASARLARLGEARELAQLASVIGRDFSYDLIARLSAPELLPLSLDDALNRLIEAGLIRRRNTAEGLAFRFRHVLLQEAAYDSLLKAKRRELHDRIVELIKERMVANLPDEIIAWHCEQAGRPLEAARYSIKAAEASAIRSATTEAERLLRSAEGHLAACATDPDADDLTLQLLATRGPVAIALFGKGSPEARSAYEQGVAICRDKGIQDRERWFPLYWGWWFTAPDFGSQQLRSEILVRDLQTAGDPEIRLQSLHCAWATSFHSGKHAECLDLVEQGLALYDPERARASRVRYGGHDARVCGLGERALSLWFMGNEEASNESCDAAVAWAEETEHLGSLIHALDYAIVLRRYQNQHDEVAALARRMEEIAAAHVLPGAKVKAKMFAAWARALTSSSAEALHDFQAVLQIQREIGTEENLSIYRDMESEILAQIGRHDEALAVLNDTIDASERVGQLFWLPELYRRRARLREARGESRGASLQDVEQAIDLANRQAATALAARARADLERLSRRPPEV